VSNVDISNATNTGERFDTKKIIFEILL